MAMLKLEQATTTWGLPRAQYPHVLNDFSKNFQKIPTTLSRPIAQARSYLMETQTREKQR
jgi:hypothetical protein